MVKKNAKKEIKIKKILFAETLNKYYFPYQNYYLPLKRFCKKIIPFDIKWNYYTYGKEVMNNKFLKLIEKEKPDYVFLFIRGSEFYLDTLIKIRKVSPKTKVFNFSGDEDTAFEIFSRYLILFVDYGLVSPERYVQQYYKDGIKNVFFIIGSNNNFFKPAKLEKKYDVTFIGIEKADRYEFIKFLKENGIKINLFGWDWSRYPKFKDIYQGALDSEKMVEVINQSKINLAFSKSNDRTLHATGRIYDLLACKSFVLTEYCKDYLNQFKEGKDIIMFKDKEDLLKKIRYYLINEKEREKIANAAYKKIIKNYTIDLIFKKIFQKIQEEDKKFTHKDFPKLNKKIIVFSKKDLELNSKELKEKLEGYDYIVLSKGKFQNLKYREYLQAYSLEKTKKPLSCCNYYVHSKILGDYIRFSPEGALKALDKKKFSSLLNINQFMITKEFFLKNIEIFRNIFENGEINFITKENTAFVTLPLIRINKFPSMDYKSLKKAFTEFIFLYQLFSLKQQKKIFSSLYLYALLFEIIKGKKFILDAIIDTLKDKDKKEKIKTYKKMITQDQK
ncbi:MAG: glycosyltransferase [Candidatus Pacearchaeota archaeon]|nr:glycosyltransferase [Candidatus Pacearchaeota archaeon]